jgi:hypothetical protein
VAGADARERVLGTIWGSRDVRVPAADGAVGGGVGVGWDGVGRGGVEWGRLGGGCVGLWGGVGCGGEGGGVGSGGGDGGRWVGGGRCCVVCGVWCMMCDVWCVVCGVWCWRRRVRRRRREANNASV